MWDRRQNEIENGKDKKVFWKIYEWFFADNKDEIVFKDIEGCAESNSKQNRETTNPMAPESKTATAHQT